MGASFTFPTSNDTKNAKDKLKLNKIINLSNNKKNVK